MILVVGWALLLMSFSNYVFIQGTLIIRVIKYEYIYIFSSSTHIYMKIFQINIPNYNILFSKLRINNNNKRIRTIYKNKERERENLLAIQGLIIQ